MTARLNPYIEFNGDARAAMGFYQEVFGGELQINTFGEFGAPDAPGAELIMHSLLETPTGFTLMGNDSPPGSDPKPGGNITISLSGRDPADGGELRGYWTRLSTGGTVIMPFAKQVWGDEFGICTDKFGHLDGERQPRLTAISGASEQNRHCPAQSYARFCRIGCAAAVRSYAHCPRYAADGPRSPSGSRVPRVDSATITDVGGCRRAASTRGR